LLIFRNNLNNHSSSSFDGEHWSAAYYRKRNRRYKSAGANGVSLTIKLELHAVMQRMASSFLSFFSKNIQLCQTREIKQTANPALSGPKKIQPCLQKRSRTAKAMLPKAMGRTTKKMMQEAPITPQAKQHQRASEIMMQRNREKSGKER
jgi:hypothetical protein